MSVLLYKSIYTEMGLQVSKFPAQKNLGKYLNTI